MRNLFGAVILKSVFIFRVEYTEIASTIPQDSFQIYSYTCSKNLFGPKLQLSLLLENIHVFEKQFPSSIL